MQVEPHVGLTGPDYLRAQVGEKRLRPASIANEPQPKTAMKLLTRELKTA